MHLANDYLLARGCNLLGHVSDGGLQRFSQRLIEEVTVTVISPSAESCVGCAARGIVGAVTRNPFPNFWEDESSLRCTMTREGP